MKFNDAEFLASYGLVSQIPKSKAIEIVFAGRSNVGKSSLINKLLNRKSIARVSATPGKTATVNFFRLDNIHLVDLPGYGYAKVSQSEKKRWDTLINGYLTSDRDIALIFQLIDYRHAPSKDDITMLNFLIENELPLVIVFTKADKLSKLQRAERMKGFEKEIPYFDDITKVEFSSHTGEGVDELKRIIESVAEDCYDE